MKHNIDDLQLALAQLEGALRTLPRDDLQTMLSSLATILADLRYYCQEARRINNELNRIPQDMEVKYLQNSIGDVRKNLALLLSQAEKIQIKLEETRESQAKRKQEIEAHQLSFEEIEAWIKHVLSMINDGNATYNHQVMKEEVSSRLQHLTELESIPEICDQVEKLKADLLEVENLIDKQQLMLQENEPKAQITASDSIDAALEQCASNISSPNHSSPSLADVSLQTGLSLIQDDELSGEAVLDANKREIDPSVSICQPVNSENFTIDTQTIENPHAQESIKVVKSSDGKHEIIEIATKNISVPVVQDHDHHELSVANPDDIIVDMRYQDALQQENVTSELNIQHATPQSFETVLMEPDDVTTEVVVDSDGTKRIIVRRLRRTLVTNRQTLQQHVAELSSTVGDGPPVIQAFSEATMKGQQLTVTKTKSDGTIEMATKQTYGGKVTTGTPGDQMNVEEYETTPQFTQRIIHGGDLAAFSPQPADISEALMEDGEYKSSSSTVHAVVQQVSRKIIRKTRRIIRKVTIIDGKEVMSEEIVEDPEEVEINEQDIPHISINVIKTDDQGKFESVYKKIDGQPLEKEHVVKVQVDTQTSSSLPSTSSKNQKQGTHILNQDVSTAAKSSQRKPTTSFTEKHIPILSSTMSLEKSSPNIENKTAAKFTVQDIQSALEKVEEIPSSRESSLKSDRTYTVDVVDFSEPKGSLHVESSSLAPQYQTNDKKHDQSLKEKHDLEYKAHEIPVEETESTAKDMSSIDSLSVEDIPPLIKPICKFEDPSIGSHTQTHDIGLAAGTVDIEPHADSIDNRTVDIGDHSQLGTTEMLHPTHSVSQKKIENLTPHIIKTETDSFIQREREGHQENQSCDDKIKVSVRPEPVHAAVELIQKVDIALSIHDREKPRDGPVVSVQSHIEQPMVSGMKIQEDKVSIILPPTTENVEVINDKITQISDVQSPVVGNVLDLTVEKENQEEKRSADKKLLDSKALTSNIQSDIPSQSATVKDVSEVAESDTNLSPQEDPDVSDGYEADQRTTVDETSPEFQIDFGKKKRKKKRKQKGRNEEEIDSLRISPDEENLTEVLPISENEDSKATKKSSKKRKRKKGDPNVADADSTHAESFEAYDVDTQTKPGIHDMSVGSSLDEINIEVPDSVQIPDTKNDKLELGVQTLKVEEINTEMQTSPRPGFDIIQQTDDQPSIENVSSQTKEPESRLTESIAIQTSPRDENLKKSSSLDMDTQTLTIELENTEIQTVSPEKNIVDAPVQTSREFMLNIEQQTTEPLEEEKIMIETVLPTHSPETSEVAEKSMQTSEVNFGLCSETRNADVQTSEIVEVKESCTNETQTVPEVISTVEIESQTTPEQLIETVSQTSPVQFMLDTEQAGNELEPLKETSELSIQTNTEEIIPTATESIQHASDTAELSVQTVTTKTEDKQINVNLIDEKSESVQEIDSAAGNSQEKENISIEESLREKTPETTEMIQLSTVDAKSEQFSDSEPIIEKSSYQDTSIKPSETSELSLTSIESTPDTSIEIQVQATIELCDSTTSDSTLQESSSKEKSSEKSLKIDRKKQKRQRCKTVEIREPIQVNEGSSTDDIFGSLPTSPDQEPSSIEPIYMKIITSSETVNLMAPQQPDQQENQPQSTSAMENATKEVLGKIHKSKIPKSSRLSNVLHISALKTSEPETSFENKASVVHESLNSLKSALDQRDIIIIEQTFVVVIESLSDWLETVESRIFVGQGNPNGPSPDDSKNFAELKDEVNFIGTRIQELNDISNDIKNNCPPEKCISMKQCIQALESQARTIIEIANEGESNVISELARWDTFVNKINEITKLTQELKNHLDNIIDSNEPIPSKLKQLEKIELCNEDYTMKIKNLINTAHELLNDYPGKTIPPEINTASETVDFIRRRIENERECLLELSTIRDDYEQSLRHLMKCTKMAEKMIANDTPVSNLAHLNDEIQTYRKFFTSMNHAKAILESLADNLDPETREAHRSTHDEIILRTSLLLDQAMDKLQKMLFAASKWTVLDQGFKEETDWLRVAHQRIPDVHSMASTEVEQYILLYQALASDIATHHNKIFQIFENSHELLSMITIENMDNCYEEAYCDIDKLKNDVNHSLRRLISFRESWDNQELLVNKLENWMVRAERELSNVNNPVSGQMARLWEIEAQYGMHDNVRKEARNSFEEAMQLIPVSDELLQRQFYGDMQQRWNKITNELQGIRDSLKSKMSSEDLTLKEKLSLIDKEIQEIQGIVHNLHGVIKVEEELDLYTERLSVLYDRIRYLQDELGKLGLLSPADSERVGGLIGRGRQLELELGKELQNSRVLRDRLRALKRAIERIRKKHSSQTEVLDQCEASEKESSECVATAIKSCEKVAEDLKKIWPDIMAARGELHSLPTNMRVSMSPQKMERAVSGLFDKHDSLNSRCRQLLERLNDKLALWRRFEKQVEAVQKSVAETDCMMELIEVEGKVDYDRLLKATERLENLNCSFLTREQLINELKAAAEPLRASCSDQVGQRVDAVVNETVQSWEETKHELGDLCDRYQRAVRLWERYRDASAAINDWVDEQMSGADGVAAANSKLPPEQAIQQVKLCEDTLAEHKERLVELRGLVAQIASDVGLDASDQLQTDVEALGRRLDDVKDSLSSIADTADSRAFKQEMTRNDLYQTKSFLDSVHESVSTVGVGESKEQLKLLQNHLLALTRTETQIQSIKERAFDNVKPHDPSIVEVLQLWQSVFRETFQQYHRLSARLVRSQDVAAALRLWQEYLRHVQDFLSSTLPGDYNGLAEDRSLCEVHENLLNDQQRLIDMVRAEEDHGDLSLAEQFSILTNLHNESLARIVNRHSTVQERIAAWEKYRQDQHRMLDWLKEIDREKSNLQLRFIRARGVDKILKRIDALLERMPAGASLFDSLLSQQEYLLANVDEALAVSVRMEYAANGQRLSSTRAGLETWKDFVLKIKGLNDQHSQQTARMTDLFRELGQAIGAISATDRRSLAETRRLIASLQEHKIALVNATRDLDELGNTTKQLREFLSPVDMKSLNQQGYLLWQRHGELEHQLALLSYKLNERCGLQSRWESRADRLLLWIVDTEARIRCFDANHEPEEALERLETEIQADMALKQRELDWIQSNGAELLKTSDSEDRGKIQKSLDDVTDRWNKLLVAGKARASKIIELMQTMSGLLKKLDESRAWLSSIEEQLSEAYTIESASSVAIEKKLRDHEQLQKSIEARSGNIGEVLNLCEMLLNDCDAWKASFSTDSIRNNMDALSKRWKEICIKSTERKRKINLIGKLFAELESVRTEQEEWIIGIERDLTELESSLSHMSKDDTDKALEQVQRKLVDVQAHEPALQILEQCYSKLAKTGLELNNLKALTGEARDLIDRWHALPPRINAVIAALEKDQRTYREFVSAHGAAVIGLTKVDVMLTQLQHLSPEPESTPRRLLQRLDGVEAELNRQASTLRRADELGLRLMRESSPEDVAAIQYQIDEYQQLWRNVKDRIDGLRKNVDAMEQQKREVDEAVQVETLKFERDTAVQVNTLPKVTRMTSFDAYLIELEAAVSECKSSMEALAASIQAEPMPGTGLSTTARTIAKQIGSCQSSIELVKHLHDLLSDEDNVAKSNEVVELTSRCQDLIQRARAREQQIRQLKSPLAGPFCFRCDHDGGRLTCPLCSHRNWAQLDNDLWRLEKWLEFAEGTQSEQHTPPADIEILEDVVQDHHEFLLDLDSHKSIIVSLNIVGSHLADHTEDTDRATELRDRLACANVRWDKVCHDAASWQNALQIALMGNQQFHQIIEELLAWLTKTDEAVRAIEPIDLSEGDQVLRAKYDKFKELQSDLERCEPRVLSLQESANHLLEESSETRVKLQVLKLRLQSLRRLTTMYVLKLGSALGLDPSEIGLATVTTSLALLSRNLLDGATTGTTDIHGTNANADDGEPTVLARGYHFIGRVLRASLPIQAVMLLLLGAASMVPSVDDDYSCMISRSLTPLVRYPNGPPPI
ncbi:nesprin-1-like [Trichogramma pretiosum]|uniref:nesprin-1-like n=1 Tax=Trichogramma pretiosum TaxID=7493 RepID=UPI000C7192C7|nr:nesprin-1-like [Trichogramma pretiosum]